MKTGLEFLHLVIMLYDEVGKVVGLMYAPDRVCVCGGTRSVPWIKGLVEYELSIGDCLLPPSQKALD